MYLQIGMREIEAEIRERGRDWRERGGRWKKCRTIESETGSTGATYKNKDKITEQRLIAHHRYLKLL